MAVSSDTTLTNNGTITVNDGGTLKNNGSIEGRGTVTNDGSIVNNSSIVCKGNIKGNGTLENNGEIELIIDGNNVIDGDVTIPEHITVTNEGNLYILSGCSLTVNGKLINTGEILYLKSGASLGNLEGNQPVDLFSAGGDGTPDTIYAVTFETNGGNKIDSVKVSKNGTLSKPTEPTKDGYAFDGWYSDKEFTTAYDFAAKVTKSFTIYAKWTEKETEPDKPTQPTEPTAPEWKNPFTDVSENDWFYSNVKYVNKNGLMSGTTNTTFAPNEPLTRGMLVTVLYRAEGEPAVNMSMTFADVDANAYYANAVIWAQQNGIVNGVTENEFASDDNITREQIAAILQRFLESNK